ncbi:MAG TPA: IS5 family transposase [Nitrospiraceae bacterium]|nr:IS5 family transposase [Nitrospiraceae bacterium]
MDYATYLREDQWERIKDSLPGKVGDVGRTGDNRRCIEAVMWIGRTGAPWRSLPRVYGRWAGVHQRFRRGARAGIWQMIFNTLAVDADTEWLMIEATIIRAHPHAAGATGGKQTQALGRCRGGVTTKLPAVCDALGNPLRFIVTGGERHDCTQAQALLEGFHAQAVLADKGYDADELVTWIQQTGAVAVIPPRSNRTVRRDYDKTLYRERNLVERMLGYLKHFRRVATRYDKTALSFLSFVQLAASYL